MFGRINCVLKKGFSSAAIRSMSLTFHSKDIAKVELKNDCLWVQFDREKETNPFSRQLTVTLTQLFKKAAVDSSLKCVVLTGGPQRSFSAGGDFNDVRALKEVEETKIYLYEIIDLYQSILAIPHPTLSLIDHYAIGQGLQVALMTDLRLATDRSQISMPELKNGVACPLGATILESFFGRGQMLEDVVGCSMMNAQQALTKKYFNFIFPPDKLFTEGEKWVQQLSSYSPISFHATKKIFNQKLIEALENVRIPAGRAHVDSIMSKAGQDHFNKILAKK